MRAEFAGAAYHVTSRGNDHHDIFVDDSDRDQFLTLLGAVCEAFDWKVYSFCLMDNHFHLVVGIGAPTLSRGMQSLKSRYTRYFNKRYKRRGHLFGDRFKALLVDCDMYLLPLVRFVARRPVLAGWVDKPNEWRWSAHNALSGEGFAPKWLDQQRVWRLLGKSPKRAAGLYRDMVAQGEKDRIDWKPEDFAIGSVLGSSQFADHIEQAFGTRSETESEAARMQGLRKVLISTEAPDEAISRAYLEEDYTLGEIVDELGLHPTAIGKIIRRHRNRND